MVFSNNNLFAKILLYPSHTRLSSIRIISILGVLINSPYKFRHHTVSCRTLTAMVCMAVNFDGFGLFLKLGLFSRFWAKKDGLF